MAQTHAQWSVHNAARKGRTSTANALLRKPEHLYYVNEINIRDKYGFAPLHYASIIGDPELASLLLSSGCNTEITTKRDRTALQLAARHGHACVVELLLEHGCDVDARVESGWTALYSSVFYGHSDVIEALVRGGCDVNAAITGGRTALHFTSHRNFLNCIGLLLTSRTIIVNAVTDTGSTALHIAAGNGHMRAVRKLIQADSEVNIKDNFGETALHRSARNGHSDVIKFLIKNGCDINASSHRGETALHLCVNGNHLEALNDILSNKQTDLNSLNIFQSTALQAAAERGHEQVTAKLLDSGCDVNIADMRQWTALHYAAANGHTGVISMLIDQDCSVNAVSRKCQTALHLALLKKHYKSVNLLLRSGCDVNLQNADAQTALHILVSNYTTRDETVMSIADAILNSVTPSCDTANSDNAFQLAVKMGFSPIAKVFINAGQCISGQDLRTAVENEDNEMVKLLVGSDVNFRECDNEKAPLLITAAQRGDSDIVHLLLPHCDVTASDHKGWTALHHAAANGHCDIILELIEISSDLNLTTNTGSTALHLSVWNNHVDVVDVLLASGCVNMNASNNYGSTPLHLAAEKGYNQVVNLLIKSGCNVNLTNKCGWTVLHCAAFNGHTDVISQLVNQTANKNAVNQNRETAFHLASKQKHLKSMKVLLNNGCDVNLKNIHDETALYTLLRNISSTDIHAVTEIVKLIVNSVRPPCDSENREEAFQFFVQNGAASIVKKCVRDGIVVSGKSLQTVIETGSSDMIELMVDSAESIQDSEEAFLPVLWKAAQRGHTDIVQLLSSRCDVTVADHSGQSALHYAAAEGHLGIVQLLLPLCDVTAIDDDGRSVLHHAAAGGHCDVIETLLSCSQTVDVNLLDNAGNSPLMCAAMHDNKDAFRCLLSHGSDVNKLDEDGDSALNYAIEIGDITIVKRLQERNEFSADLSLQDAHGDTPLMYAVAYDQQDILKYLLDQGCDVNRQNKNDCAALHFAVLEGNIHIVKRLIKNSKFSADLNLQDNDGDTPLILATNNEHEEIIECLLFHGCDVNISSSNGCSPLHCAVERKRLKIVNLLLEHSKQPVDINLKDNDGNTPLIKSVIDKNEEIVECLLGYGCDVNMQNNDGYSALHYARVEEINSSILMGLVKHSQTSADLNQQDSDGDTPLIRATKDENQQTVECLLAQGCDVNIRNKGGFLALHYAVENTNLIIVKQLLEYSITSADLNLQRNNGDTPLILATMTNNDEIVECLLARGCDVNIQSKEGAAALHYAVKGKNLNLVNLLLENSKLPVDLNLQDNKGDTPLILATKDKNEEIVDCLLAYGSDVNIQNANSHFALYLAAQKGHISVVMKLLKYGCDVNLKDKNNQTTLFELIKSCTSSNVGTTKKIVEIMLNTVTSPCDGKNRDTSFSLAVKIDAVFIVEVFIEAGQCPSEHDLRTAVENGYYIMTELLIDSFTKIYEQEVQGIPLLCLAAQRGSPDIVDLLLPRCDVTATDDEGRTALHHACLNGHSDIAESLCSGAKHLDINSLEESGNTPIMCTVTNNHVQAFHKLLELGSDINMRNTKDGNTAFILAAQHGHKEMWHALLDLGCDVNIQNADGLSALLFAAANGDKDFINRMIEHKGCDLQLRSNHQQTALHLAAAGDHSEIVEILLSQQRLEWISDKDLSGIVRSTFETLSMADVRYKSHLARILNKLIVSDMSGKANDAFALAIEIVPVEFCLGLLQKRPQFAHSQFDDGETALHCAVRKESKQLCEALLINGSDTKKRWNNQTALEYAMCHNVDAEIVDLLVKHTESDDPVVDACKASLFVGESLSSLTQRVGSTKLKERLCQHDDDRNFHVGKKLTKHNKITEQKTMTSWSQNSIFSKDTQSDVIGAVLSCNRPQLEPESDDIKSAIIDLLNCISEHMQQDNLMSHLAFTPRLTGSTQEGTKTFRPNELDVICELKTSDFFKDSDYRKHVISNGVYVIDTADPDYGQDFRAVDPRVLAQEFYEAMSKILRNITRQNVSFPSLVLHKHTLQLHDKISTLHLIWTGDVFENMMIYVDLVPAFTLTNAIKTPPDLPLVEYSHKYHAIAKKSRHNYSGKKSDCLFSFSFSLHENEFVSNISENIRLGYTLAKAVRIAAISKPRDLSGLTLDEDEKINSEGVITTYMLKTCLMTLYEEHQADDSKMQANDYIWTEMIYQKLFTCIHNRKLETYYGDGVLFQCGDHADDDRVDRVCCQKRLLILRMCDAILTWLNENRCELNDRLSTSSG